MAAHVAIDTGQKGRRAFYRGQENGQVVDSEMVRGCAQKSIRRLLSAENFEGTSTVGTSTPDGPLNPWGTLSAELAGASTPMIDEDRASGCSHGPSGRRRGREGSDPSWLVNHAAKCTAAQAVIQPSAGAVLSLSS